MQGDVVPACTLERQFRVGRNVRVFVLLQRVDGLVFQTAELVLVLPQGVSYIESAKRFNA